MRYRIQLVRAFDLLIVVALVAAAWHVSKSGMFRQRQEAQLSIGSKLSVPSVDWTKRSRHTVLFISRSCKACQDSLPFYKKLSSVAANAPDSQMLILSAESPSLLQPWLAEEGITGALVAKVDPAAVGFTETPTLLMVDSTGTVTDIAMRRLPADAEQQVFRRLENTSSKPFNRSYLIPERSRADLPGPGVLVDARERDLFAKGHSKGAVNIPVDELSDRARAELGDPEHASVDCSYSESAACRVAAEKLQALGFRNVAIVR